MKKFASLFACLVLCLTVCVLMPAHAHAAGESKENAAAYTLDTTLNGSITEDARENWYRFEVPTGCSMYMSTFASIEKINYDIYNEDDELMACYENVDWDEQTKVSNVGWDFELPEGGTYYLEITHPDYVGTYTFTLTLIQKDNFISCANRCVSYDLCAHRIKLSPTAWGGTFIYKSLSSKLTVSKNGYVTIPAKFTGTGYIKITAHDPTGLYSDVSVKITVTVPKPTKLSAATNQAGNKLKVRWRKSSAADGYQVRLVNTSYLKEYTSTTERIYTVPGNSNLSKTITGLKKGRTYKVYVRTYMEMNGKKYYSDWSAYKSVRITK